jgi:hypothetical protein
MEVWKDVIGAGTGLPTAKNDAINIRKISVKYDL